MKLTLQEIRMVIKWFEMAAAHPRKFLSIKDRAFYTKLCRRAKK